ncbi:MAG: hypothetical protein A2075_10040 [Geobacteraceae bacterium GWC2_58_44]|nr:MAG: hypothetical protein A2075_10040 [Geobacteraceae bacterium GWC2_58_44]
MTNSTGKSGRIYLTVKPLNGDSNQGTSIATAGAFTIDGVPAGTQYAVHAFVDTQGTGIRHANDPRGVSAAVTVPADGNVSVGTFAVTLPTLVPVQAPQAVVYAGSGVNFVKWQGAEDGNGLPVAEKYTVSWSTSITGSPLGGSREVWSGDQDYFVHLGSSALFYRVVAHVGSTTASSGWVQVSPSTGTGSVTGKIFFPGVTATGRLYVVLVNEFTKPPVVRVATVASPVSGGSYSVNDVPAGSYNIFPFLDLNSNGSYDVGDIGLADANDYNPTVTVATSLATAPDLTLDNANGSTVLTTGHGKSDTWEWFNLVLSVHSMKKQVVSVRLSGPQLPGPVDVARENSRFHTRIGMSRQTVGDAYQVAITYSDGSSETVTEAITGVLDGFVTPIAPVGYIPFNAAPTFSWSPPSPAPAAYIYSIWLSNADGVGVWGAWGLPSSRTSIVYGSEGDTTQPLIDGTNYSWIANVTDRNGNMTARQTSFTPTTAPALSGFSPAGGLAGTTVTLSGVNFGTNPASHTVRFNGTPATVSAATSSSLTVTVPAGATTGTIQLVTGGRTLTSTKQFIVSAPLNIRGLIRTRANAPIAGARVEVAEDPTVFALTGSDGSFTLQPVFRGQNVTLKATGSGYLPTYSTAYPVEGSLNLTPYPYHLYTRAELTGWGVTSGNGVIAGLLLNTGTAPNLPVPGAQATATGTLNAGPYPVSYHNGTTLGGTSTYSNGQFLVLNVRDFDHVEIIAAKSAWTFYYTGFNVRADSVTEGAVFGSTTPPSIASFSPAAGRPGSAVVITGVYFSAVAAENVVKFNGVAATVTAATPTTLTVKVPAAAKTGPVSVTTAGVTASSETNIFTVRHGVTVSVTGTGTVTSNPPGITCTISSCTALFDQGSSVNLLATADVGGQLNAWSGACSGSGTCVLTMDADKSVTAAFSQLGYIKIGTNLYSVMQSAFDAAATGDTIQAQARVFTSNSFRFDRPAVQVKLKGGCDSSFLTNGGFTTLDGRLNVQDGTLRVEKVRIR